MNFKSLSWLSVLVLAWVVAAKDSSEVTELKIDTTYTPEDCTVTAQKGDSIKVHYVSPLILDYELVFNVLNATTCFQAGTLYEDGKKFDSRCVTLNNDTSPIS